MIDNKGHRFLKSALSAVGRVISNVDVLTWVERRNREVRVDINPTTLSSMEMWYFDESEGRIRHRSGKFFSIDGIDVKTNIGKVHEWRQPIINQPEIGYLGLIARDIDGVMHFLVQAKIEPGNVNNVQLSPTLQATKSNYTRTHKGKAPKFLEYFLDEKRKVLLDQLQSEQGARFLHKRNRNIIIEVSEDIPYDEDFRWLTLGQIKYLTGHNNLVNMDLRTVVSGIPYGHFGNDSLALIEHLSQVENPFYRGILTSAMNDQVFYRSFDDIISWFTALKVKSELCVMPVHLKKLSDWEVSEQRISHHDNLYFDVLWVNVTIANREIASWQQPLVAPREKGIVAFLVKRINGIYHFLVQAKLECGNFDILEFSPTVQCITGSYKNSLETVPFLRYVLEATPEQIHYDVLQSEEGGRFYHEQNRNMIVECDDDFPLN